MAYLLGIDWRQLAEPGAHVGRLLEAFVYQELRKQITWSGTQPSLHYYRTASNREVDFVLQRRGGRTTRHARRSDTAKSLCKRSAASLRRAGLTIFPRPNP